MVNGVCKKHYLQAFFEETTQGEDSYLIYRRRNDGQMFQKTLDGFTYNNRWGVVPHNPYFTKMFNAHINVEMSTDIQNVKYLFKYIYKSPDHVGVVIVSPTNEI
jgi:hypothetical protein